MHIPVTPLFLSVSVGLVLGLIAWGYLRARQSELSDIMVGACDGVLLGLVLAGIAFVNRRSGEKTS